MVSDIHCNERDLVPCKMALIIYSIAHINILHSYLPSPTDNNPDIPQQVYTLA